MNLEYLSQATYLRNQFISSDIGIDSLHYSIQSQKRRSRSGANWTRASASALHPRAGWRLWLEQPPIPAVSGHTSGGRDH